jgi:hypothetical protein
VTEERAINIRRMDGKDIEMGIKDTHSMKDITETIRTETGLQAKDYRLTHEGRRLPDNNTDRERIRHRIAQGDTVQIKITGR